MCSHTEDRALWQAIESIHAVTYFVQESKAAARNAGLRGFWMGYFGFRAAPLGHASPGLVDATFANFAPAMVRRSVPDVWDYASPTDLLRARATSAATALRRISPRISDVAAETNGPLAALVESGSPLGRPLYGANQDLHNDFDDPVEHLWQLCTAFREHRGDGHLMALATSEIDGCEAHLLSASITGIEHSVLQGSRGWTDDEWNAAARRLEARGLLDGITVTAAGQQLHETIEAQTDRLALNPLDGLTAALAPSAADVAASNEIPFPKPIGLPSSTSHEQHN